MNRRCLLFNLIYFVLSVLNIGCSASTSVYDVSQDFPFSKYSYKTVALTEPMVLFEDPIGGFKLHTVDPKNLHADNSVLLNAGEKVHVLDTKVDFFEGAWIAGNFKSASVVTNLSIEVNRKDWPNVVHLQFNPCWHTSNVYHAIPISPSPWEPEDTPNIRRLAWPSESQFIERMYP